MGTGKLGHPTGSTPFRRMEIIYSVKMLAGQEGTVTLSPQRSWPQMSLSFRLCQVTGPPPLASSEAILPPRLQWLPRPTFLPVKASYRLCVRTESGERRTNNPLRPLKRKETHGRWRMLGAPHL